jgi:hypothetical protein
VPSWVGATPARRELHWQSGVSVNVPIGDDDEGDLANMSFDHWATDLYATASWLDTNIGLELLRPLAALEVPLAR